MSVQFIHSKERTTMKDSGWMIYINEECNAISNSNNCSRQRSNGRGIKKRSGSPTPSQQQKTEAPPPSRKLPPLKHRFHWRSSHHAPLLPARRPPSMAVQLPGNGRLPDHPPPLAFSYLSRLRRNPTAKPLLMTIPIFCACAVLGVMTGADDFIYAYGLSFLPVSTSAILISTQLAFTAFFAFLVVRQRFTPFSLNSVALLTVGAVVLGMHASSDIPAGVSKRQYFAGFILSLGAAALYGLVLPLVELTYRKAKQEITYTLVMEMQFVMGAFATAFCVVGMAVNRDFEVIPREARRFGLGEADYWVILVASAVLWEFCFLGAVGVIFCGNTLLAGVIIAVFIPVTEALGVVFYREKFGSEKGVALALSLWGLASYSYGEYLEGKKKKKDDGVNDQTV